MNLLLLEPTDWTSSDQVCLTGRRLRHLQQVLAVSPGDSLRVGQLNGQVGTATVLTVDSREARLAVTLQAAPPPPSPVTLVLALPRPKALRRVLQGVSAMGVKRIILLNAWRVEKSYWQSPFLGETALREHLILGLEQARDTMLPEVVLERRFKPFVEDRLPQLIEDRKAWVAHPGAPDPCPHAVETRSVLVVGPEGGFIPYEVDALIAAGCHPVHVGERILRVETAVSALLGRLQSP